MFKKLFLLVLPFLVIGLAIYTGDKYRYTISDWWELRSYTAPAEISGLSTRSGLSDYGQTIFYVSDPQLLSATEFNQVCPGEKSKILGCYDGFMIYIYDVNEPELAGIKETTAAHEMLHAAYARISGGERKELNKWLGVAREQITDQRVLDVIDSYDQDDKETLYNELHSIIGTEVEVIPEFLDNYYKRYFSNRSSVVKQSQQYEQVFADIESKADTLDAELKSIGAVIKQLELTLEQQSKNITANRAALGKLLAAEQYEQYNSLVTTFNQSIGVYNATVTRLETQLNKYNKVVKERKGLTLKQNELVQSIDSTYDKQESEE